MPKISTKSWVTIQWDSIFEKNCLYKALLKEFLAKTVDLLYQYAINSVETSIIHGIFRKLLKNVFVICYMAMQSWHRKQQKHSHFKQINCLRFTLNISKILIESVNLYTLLSIISINFTLVFIIHVFEWIFYRVS